MLATGNSIGLPRLLETEVDSRRTKGELSIERKIEKDYVTFG